MNKANESQLTIYKLFKVLSGVIIAQAIIILNIIYCVSINAKPQSIIDNNALDEGSSEITLAQAKPQQNDYIVATNSETSEYEPNFLEAKTGTRLKDCFPDDAFASYVYESVLGLKFFNCNKFLTKPLKILKFCEKMPINIIRKH